MSACGRGLVSTKTLENARYDLSDQADKLNIILISLDALRYDVTGLNGGESATPNLLQFANESVVFHKFTSAPWTLPSYVCLDSTMALHSSSNKQTQTSSF